MTTSLRDWVCLASLALVLCVAGCGLSDERVLAERTRLLLTAEPADALPVLEIAEHADPEQSVVVVGLIGGVSDPWSAGKAAFVIADPSLMADLAHHEGASGHCDCPFCQRKETDPTGLAMVEFRDADGKVLSIDARKLFDVAARETVVVRGRPRLDASGYLVIAADGLYIRR